MNGSYLLITIRFQLCNKQVFHPFIPTLVPLIVNSVFDPFYKIATEALLVLQHLVKVIRPTSTLILFFFYSKFVKVIQLTIICIVLCFTYS